MTVNHSPVIWCYCITMKWNFVLHSLWKNLKLNFECYSLIEKHVHKGQKSVPVCWVVFSGKKYVLTEQYKLNILHKEKLCGLRGSSWSWVYILSEWSENIWSIELFLKYVISCTSLFSPFSNKNAEIYINFLAFGTKLLHANEETQL